MFNAADLENLDWFQRKWSPNGDVQFGIIAGDMVRLSVMHIRDDSNVFVKTYIYIWCNNGIILSIH